MKCKMEYKLCNRCKKIKKLECFPKSGKYYRNKCKECKNEERRKPKLQEKQEKFCTNCNKNKNINDFGTRKRESGKIYILKNCKECEKIRKKQPEYKKKVSENRKNKYENDEKYKNCMLERAGNYYKQNVDKVKNYQSKYHKKPEIINRRNKKRYDRRQTDEEYKIYCNISSRIHKLLKSNKIYRTNKYIGCTPKFMKQWLEWQFDSKMSWYNYATYWQIDHVIPCASFKLNSEEEQLRCFNWKNCRPLESLTNNSKKAKILPKQILLQHIRVTYYKKYFATYLEAGNS